jgi:hypothetical protein
MIEDLLIGLGLKCGTVKNFNTIIMDASRQNQLQMWYFLTPIKGKDNGSGYMEATINLAFPILAVQGDINEISALSRISEIEKTVKPELINLLKKWMNVPSSTFSIIPFWSNEKGERNELKDFGNVRIHIINAVLTVKYRETWFNCNC